MVKTIEEAKQKVDRWLKVNKKTLRSYTYPCYFSIEVFRYVTPSRLFELLDVPFSFAPTRAKCDIYDSSALMVPAIIYVPPNISCAQVYKKYLNEVEVYIRDRIKIPEDVKIFKYV